MTHVSTRTIESKALPGVRFVIRKMSKRRADALDEKQAPFTARLKVIYDEVIPLEAELFAQAKTPQERVARWLELHTEAASAAEKPKRWAELTAQVRKINDDEMAPVAVRFCLVRIEDLDITYPGADGEDVTAPAILDLIMEHGAGPEGNQDALYQEILHEIKRECGLLPEEAANLPSPSTSAAAVDGEAMSAEPVEKLEVIPSADA